MKIYVASSWRNEFQPKIVSDLRALGYDVYDFKARGSGWGMPEDDASSTGPFSWSAIDPEWKNWDADGYVRGIRDPIAQAGFERDMDALKLADACVMVMPCGPSASMEFGYAVGSKKLTIVFIEGIREPDLMVLMANLVTQRWVEVVDKLQEYREFDNAISRLG